MHTITLDRNDLNLGGFAGLQYAMISMKVMVASILRKYKFTTDLKLDDLVLKFELTLKLGNRYLVGMERREWATQGE